MTIRVSYEMSNTYIVLDTENYIKPEDYRCKMLTFNEIRNVLSLEFRTINNEKKLFINISGKESLLSRMNSKTFEKKDVEKLFESILLTSRDLSRYLIDEKELVLRPELIFFNSTSDEYEFICIPRDASMEDEDAGMRELLQFILSRLQTEDEDFVNTMYTICDMYSGSIRPGFEQVFNYFMEETIQVSSEEIPEAEDLEETGSSYPRYIPSFKEIGAYAMCVAGFLLIFFNIYLSMP